MEGLRHENKYFISRAGYQLLRARLRAAMELDGHAAEDRRYLIRSLYFDDYRQSCLMEKIDGLENREKFRLRFYEMDRSFIRLESKQKFGSMTRKLSAPLTEEQTRRLLEGDAWFLYDTGQPLLRDFYLKYRTQLLRPAVLVDYMREAYVYRDVRITFDLELHSGRDNLDFFNPEVVTVPVLPPDRVILEIKFDDDLPYAVRQLLKPVPAVRSAISKYALCRGDPCLG